MGLAGLLEVMAEAEGAVGSSLIYRPGRPCSCYRKRIFGCALMRKVSLHLQYREQSAAIRYDLSQNCP